MSGEPSVRVVAYVCARAAVRKLACVRVANINHPPMLNYMLRLSVSRRRRRRRRRDGLGRSAEGLSHPLLPHLGLPGALAQWRALRSWRGVCGLLLWVK